MSNPVHSICIAKLRYCFRSARDVYIGRSILLKQVCALGNKPLSKLLPLIVKRLMLPSLPCSTAKPCTQLNSKNISVTVSRVTTLQRFLAIPTALRPDR
eukprot:17166-Heterococcus_DN1.PRE.4